MKGCFKTFNNQKDKLIRVMIDKMTILTFIFQSTVITPIIAALDQRPQKSAVKNNFLNRSRSSIVAASSQVLELRLSNSVIFAPFGNYY